MISGEKRPRYFLETLATNISRENFKEDYHSTNENNKRTTCTKWFFDDWCSIIGSYLQITKRRLPTDGYHSKYDYTFHVLAMLIGEVIEMHHLGKGVTVLAHHVAACWRRGGHLGWQSNPSAMGKWYQLDCCVRHHRVVRLAGDKVTVTFEPDDLIMRAATWMRCVLLRSTYAEVTIIIIRECGEPLLELSMRKGHNTELIFTAEKMKNSTKLSPLLVCELFVKTLRLFKKEQK